MNTRTRKALGCFALLAYLALYAAAAILGIYGVANVASSLLASRGQPMGVRVRVPLACAILHFSYGLGFLVGLIRFGSRWGAPPGNLLVERSAKAGTES